MAATNGMPAGPSMDELGIAHPGENRNETTALSLEERRIEQLQRQVVALQRISSLGVLAGGVFHELNNALTPILSYAKLALRNPDPAYRERALKQIIDASERAADITRSMLGLSRPGGANDRTLTDLKRLVDEVAQLTRKDLVKHRMRLETRLEGRPHAQVNPAQIQQVLLNLIINARQAMNPGGTVRLGLKVDETGRKAEISVADTGTGIAPADLRRIFEPFYSTKAEPDAAGQGGTGLGLSVCRDIIEAHHGRLRAQSRPGQGAVFTIILPLAQDPEAVVHAESA